LIALCQPRAKKFEIAFAGRLTDSAWLTALLARFFLEIFAVKNIPFTASWRHMTGKRANLMTNDIVNLVLALKKTVQSLFGFQKCPPLVGKFGKSLLAQTAHDQMSEMRDSAL